MKHLFPVLFLALYPTLSCLAQDKDSLEKRLPVVIVQTGISLQWFGSNYQLSTFSVEKPLANFWHLGLQGSYYFKRQPDYFNSNKFLGGLEVGVFAKYFLHGRFSGRKSGLYMGPEIRFGSRRFKFLQNDIFPPPTDPEPVHYKATVSKIMFRWGVQWQFGHANLEIASPFGIEIYKPTLKGYNNGRETQFVMLPMLQLGVAF